MYFLMIQLVFGSIIKWFHTPEKITITAIKMVSLQTFAFHQ